MTRFSLLSAASLVGLCLCCTQALAIGYPDVPFEHANNAAIVYMQKQEIATGYPDGTFRPDTTINRAEFTKIMVKAIGQSEPIHCSLSEEGFQSRDVSESAWYAPYLCVAARMKMVNGYPDGTFKPEANISSAEAAKIIATGFGLPTTQTDVWYEGYVRALHEQRMNPTTLHLFDTEITRGGMAEMIFRFKVADTSQPSLAYEDMGLATFNLDGVSFTYPKYWGEPEEPTDGSTLWWFTNAGQGTTNVFLSVEPLNEDTLFGENCFEVECTHHYTWDEYQPLFLRQATRTLSGGVRARVKEACHAPGEQVSRWIDFFLHDTHFSLTTGYSAPYQGLEQCPANAVSYLLKKHPEAVGMKRFFEEVDRVHASLQVMTEVDSF